MKTISHAAILAFCAAVRAGEVSPADAADVLAAARQRLHSIAAEAAPRQKATVVNKPGGPYLPGGRDLPSTTTMRARDPVLEGLQVRFAALAGGPVEGFDRVGKLLGEWRELRAHRQTLLSADAYIETQLRLDAQRAGGAL